MKNNFIEISQFQKKLIYPPGMKSDSFNNEKLELLVKHPWLL